MTTEHKVIGGIGIATLVLVIGGAFFLTRDAGSSVPADQLVSKGAIHWHPKVSIYIKGKKQLIENGIGIAPTHQEIHTHEEDYKDGVVHMEMQGPVTKDETKLGNFFKIWGKEFSSTKLFDKTNGADEKVIMLVNGKKNTEFENYLMKDKDNIEIRFE